MTDSLVTQVEALIAEWRKEAAECLAHARSQEAVGYHDEALESHRAVAVRTKFADQLRALLVLIVEQRRELVQLRRDARGVCRHCGDVHPDHIACASDWAGVDRHGR